MFNGCTLGVACERDKETDRQTETEIDRETERKRGES